jgi:hypothetical protein
MGMRESTVSRRDRGLHRLRRTTTVVLATCGALAAAFAGLAAKALPGRHTSTSTTTTTNTAAHTGTAAAVKATAPALVPVRSAASPAAPAAPAAPPVQTQSPPVVVSGGT